MKGQSRARCSVCHRPILICDNGMLRAHRDGPHLTAEWCMGSYVRAGDDEVVPCRRCSRPDPDWRRHPMGVCDACHEDEFPGMPRMKVPRMPLGQRVRNNDHREQAP